MIGLNLTDFCLNSDIVNGCGIDRDENIVEMKSRFIAIVILIESSWAIAPQIQAMIPDSQIYGLKHRVTSADIFYDHFGDTVKQLFEQGNGIIGICAAGILIRTLAPMLSDKRIEPMVLAIAEDGSAVVPLLGGLNGANELAKEIAKGLKVKAAITTSGEVRWQTNLLSPPSGYVLINSDREAKVFVSDLLAGATVSLLGGQISELSWLSNIPFCENGTHTIQIIDRDLDSISGDRYSPAINQLVYYRSASSTKIPQKISQKFGSLAIVGIGPGSKEWLSPQVKNLLENATDLVGYKTYLDLVSQLSSESVKAKNLHSSDNRVESDRAKQGLNLAAEGRSVVIVSSGDPGIYAMAAAVFEVLESKENPKWEGIQIEVAPGISAMQAAAAQVGAPLGHDFCVISLSDILKPWAAIASRLKAAVKADLVIAIYNPRSSQRISQLIAAKEILLEQRSPSTPVIVATSLGREAQNVKIIELAELLPDSVNMQTVLIVGSSQTRKFKRDNGEVWVYTPRSYPDLI
jgi:cobalt-precorrin 5A hydrolase / precorrin-3B C17-methyltransferase